MYTTSEQVYVAANNLTDNIGGLFSELVRLIFALLNTLIDCVMYAFNCIISNPILLVFVFCFVYYVRRKYYVRK